MKVEVVEVAPKSAEVLFVVGGVYRQTYLGSRITYWLMAYAQGKYRWVDLTDNRTGDETYTIEEMKRTIRNCGMTFIPGAVLHIPKEVG